MKKVNYFLAMMMLITMGMFSSCNVEERFSDVFDSAEDDANINESIDEAIDEAEDAALNNESKSKSAVVGDTSGRSISVVWNSETSRTITITFDNFSNSRRKSNKVKNGVIKINIDGFHYSDQYKKTLTYENFTINDHQIEGTLVVEKVSDYVYSIKMDNGKVTFSDGKTYTRVVNRIRTQVSGTQTPLYVWDDIYEIEGTSTGVNRRGNEYEHSISEPLVRKMGWPYLIQGIVKITIEEKELTIDYGDGTLDNQATVTYNGKTRNVRLK